MKKVAVVLLLFVCMLVGCGQKESVQEVTPTIKEESISIIQSASKGASSPDVAEETKSKDSVFQYKATKNSDCIAVDKEGLLYVATCNLVPKNTSQTITIYDLDGRCIEEQVLDITVGQGKNLIVGEKHLYLLAPETDCWNVLYQIDLVTWEAKRLYTFTEFESVADIVLLGDTIYVLGTYASLKEKEFFEYQEWYANRYYNNNVIAYLHINEETPKLGFLQVDLPIYIFGLTENTLGIYTDKEKFTRTILEYSPTENTFEALPIAHDTTKLALYHSFQGCEDGILMVRNIVEICYILKDGTEKKVFNSSSSFYEGNVLYANGYFFYQHRYKANIVERVSIEEKLKEIQSE